MYTTHVYIQYIYTVIWLTKFNHQECDNLWSARIYLPALKEQSATGRAAQPVADNDPESLSQWLLGRRQPKRLVT